MPLVLSSTGIEEKNKLATDSVWYILLEITIPATPSDIVVRVVRNNENVTWNSQTWQAMAFEMDEITEDSKGEVPRVDVRVSNINRVMEQYIRDYDTYIKANGFSPISVKLYIVNSKNLASATPEVEHWFELKQPKTNAKWATFSLGAANPYNKRVPMNRILRNHCRWKFKDGNCGYWGTIVTSCNKSVSNCQSVYAPVTIVSVSKANPAIVTTASAHGLPDGTYITITEVSSNPANMWQLNGKTYVVSSRSTTTFALSGYNTNTSSFTAFTSSGGTIIPALRFGGFPGVGPKGLSF